MELAYGWLTAAVGVLAAVLLYFEYRFTYWRKRGVPHPRAVPVLGHCGPLLFGGMNLAQGLLRHALPFRAHGYCGLYQFARPVLLVWDPEMVRQILCKDFAGFHDRGVPTDDRDPLTQHLFNLAGPRWRNLRTRLSPTFTSGKLKLMLPLMRDVGQELGAALRARQRAAAGGEVNVGKLLFCYTTDVIGSVAFGIRCDSMRDEDNQFMAMAQQVFRQSAAQVARMLLESVHPRLGRLLPLSWVMSNAHRFFLGLVRDTVRRREEGAVARDDFLQLLLQLRDHEPTHAHPDEHIPLTAGVMAAQSFIFFIGGLDNVTNTVAFCLSRLAADAALQDRVAAEVRDGLQRYGGELTYEALNEMELLGRTLLEALRVWSPAGFLLRLCTATTRVGEVLVEKNTPVIILGDMMNSDESVFPEPHRFDPDRHTAEARARRHPYAFLPFGEGPRVCIAERFALLEMKLALATLLRDFAFRAGPSYEERVVLDPKACFPRPKNGFKLCVSTRE